VATYILAASAPWLASFLYTGGDTFPHARFAIPLVPTLTLLALAGVVAAVDLAENLRLRALGPPVALALAMRSARARRSRTPSPPDTASTTSRAGRRWGST